MSEKTAFKGHKEEACETLGSSTADDGTFLIEEVPPGEYELVASFVGYTPWRTHLVLGSAEKRTLRIELTPTILPGQTIVITATRARERETPATFSNITARDLADRYSTQDIPQLVSELPSVTWYSENGNRIGYNYLNILGFDQRRVSVRINGIPQNDPEDHNVYWVDFPDLAANLEDIQVQRGAGSAFYGPPAIGGSVNLVTGFSRRSQIDLLAGGGGRAVGARQHRVHAADRSGNNTTPRRLIRAAGPFRILAVWT